MDDITKEFIVESYENLDVLDQDFVALETNPAAADRIGSIFRTIHTIKGTSGCLGFSKLEKVAHVGENILSRMRDGELKVSTEIISGLLRMVDAVRQILRNIETTSGEGEVDYSELIAALTKLNEASAAVTADTATTPTANIAVAAAAEEEAPEAEPAAEAPAAPAGQAPAAQAAAAPESAAASGGIRVDVVLLDKLMNLVGELVLARNQIIQFSASTENATLAGTTQRLNLITTELQEGVMKTRMQPIGNVWNKFPRVVRDVAQNCGKHVRMEMEGRETELDKTIIEAIKDPLTHIIRNSVDHGIEKPEARKAAGKPVEGKIFLRAFHEGGQVNIEIIDDGAGINVERVKAKAIERGIITADQASRMSDREVVALIFLPGFSTAEKVTNVSGRGVGMDVVKTNIEKIGGTVDIQNKPGEGTTLRIKIPLTLAIIPALIITSAGDRFAIPQVSLLELVRLEAEEATTGIERIGGAPVYRLRGNLLPLVYLNQQLRTESGAKTGAAVVNIVVLQADERQFGLVVDEINDTEEIVVKPLGKLFKGLTTFAGATIMGDGRVALILDVMGVAQKSGVISETRDHGVHEQSAHGRDAGMSKQTLLLFRICGQRRMAIELSKVARLEEFARTSIEFSGGQAVVQYRKQIMPLIYLSDVLGSGGTQKQPEPDMIQVIVYTKDQRSVGLVVDGVVDIVEESVMLEHANVRPGVLGCAIIDRKVTEMLDIEGVINQVMPRDSGDHGAPARKAA